MRNSQSRYLKYSIVAAGILTVIWLVYSVLNSSFLYKEVITINVNGVLILLFILSLNAFSAQNLAYVQVLTVLLLMSFPVFKKTPHSWISIILILTYCFSWIIILKIKFYEFFGALEEKNVKRYYSAIYMPVVVFIIIAVLSWGFFSVFPLVEVRKGGLFLADLPGEESGLEKEYYGLQDKMLKEITEILPKFNSTKNSKDSLSLLNLMIDESPDILELDKAESGLVSYLKQEGPGLEVDEDQLILLLKDYVDKKVMLNLERNKVNLIQLLKQNRLNLVKRIGVSGQVNNMLVSGSYKDLSSSSGALEEEISDSSLSQAGKAEAKQFVRKLKKWKTYELYRKKVSSPKDNLTPEDLKEIPDLRSGLNVYFETGKLKKELENSNMPEYRKEEMKEALDDLQESKEVNSFVKSSDALISGSEQQGGAVIEDVKGLVGNKAESLIKEKHEEIEKLLNEGVLPDEKKSGFLTSLKRMEEGQGQETMDSQKMKLESDLNDFQEKGFISEKTKSTVGGKLNELTSLIPKSPKAAEEQKAPSQENSGLNEAAVGIPPKLISITLTPEYLKFPLGESRNLLAKGEYSDHAQKDITSSVEWSSSDTKIVTVSLGKIESHSMGDAKANATLEGITSRPAVITVEEPSLISIILSPDKVRIFFGTKFSLKAEGYFSDASRKDITSLVSWQIKNPGIITIDKGDIRTKLLGETSVSAEYLGLKSLPATVTVIFNLRWFLWIIFKVFCFLILGIIILLAASYIKIRRKAKRLLSLYGNPREFIIGLYENARIVPFIFGLKQEGFLPPLTYAELIEKRHSVADRLFLRFTAKFEEAKYSKHNLPADDSRVVLDYYNGFIGVLFSKNSKPSFSSKYCLALIYRTPLFIRRPI